MSTAAPTVPNSPMSVPEVLLRFMVTLIRIPLFGREAPIQDEELTAEEIRDRYDQNPLTPSLNASLRLVGKCLSQTAEGSQLNELRAYRLLKRQPHHTGDPEYDCVVADAVILMQELLPKEALRQL